VVEAGPASNKRCRQLVLALPQLKLYVYVRQTLHAFEDLKNMTSSANTRDFCDKCFTVVKHEGTPVGSYIDVPDVKEPGKNHKVYTALPEGEYSKDEAVVMCTGKLDITAIAVLLRWHPVHTAAARS
jgi:hypothetical protein